MFKDFKEILDEAYELGKAGVDPGDAYDILYGKYKDVLPPMAFEPGEDLYADFYIGREAWFHAMD